jgi:hypothetical protein
MEKNKVDATMSLNEIIENAYSLAAKYSYTPHSMSTTMPGGSNEANCTVTFKFSCGGYLSKPIEEQLEYGKNIKNLINQGFGVIDVVVWAAWGGRYYDMTPIEGTCWHALIIDRRERWDAGSFEFTNFAALETKLQDLLSKEPDTLIH